MLPMSIAEIASAVGGEIHNCAPDALVTAPVRYESHRIEPGGMFAALAGDRTDGHDHAAAACASGATAVLAARPVPTPAILVDDVRAAFGRLAAHVLAARTGLDVIGVTGSSGKTSTKDLTGHLLRRLGPTIAPPGNRNNELGVPETALLTTPLTRYLVLELGARRVGDITYLTRLVRPTVGVVLNVGSAHLGVFGSRAAIAEAKGELVAALPDTGLAVLNLDDPAVAAMATRTAARIATFGRHPAAMYHADQVTLDSDGRARFVLRTPHGSASVRLLLHGEHFVIAALAAATVALQYTPDVDLVADALGQATPVSEGRMRVTARRDGVTILDDSYNANPESAAAGLRTLAAMTRNGRRAVAVLGQMNELGPHSLPAHRELGRLTAELGVRRLVTVGNADAAEVATSARSRGVTASHVADRDSVPDLLEPHLQPGDVVLVKGSHGVGLQRVAAGLAVGSPPRLGGS